MLGQLQQEIENLTELQNKSNDPAEIKRYTVEIDKLDGLRKDFDAVKGQLKSVEETISKSADTGSKKETVISII